MATRIVLNGTNTRAAAEAAARVLTKGGILVYPTDTIYGFGCDAENKEAVDAIFSIKQRSDRQKFLVMVSNLEMARAYVEITNIALKLESAFLPGPLSMILPQHASSPLQNTLTDGPLGIRIPDNEFCRFLSKEFGKGIISTSVNLSGTPSLSDPNDIEREFGNSVDLIVDNGFLNHPPSTIVDASGRTPRILREGAIAASVIHEQCVMF